VSYLLIGFWYERSRDLRHLKAFLVNRAGDFGFLLGIAPCLGTSALWDYATVFRNAGG